MQQLVCATIGVLPSPLYRAGKIDSKNLADLVIWVNLEAVSLLIPMTLLPRT
jgi:hypothetical protein